ncbi:hypothetical protein NDU88_004671 [Pleurodeles waltl]|uniref:Uncharacterized protein n=1 Tax=Pleurodeles waltl TaxID=8319 RepID=A0AAV7WW64_PLEWA|nr:hypothetical protein NDU88_004671 [Pleurodeles waltl]
MQYRSVPQWLAGAGLRRGSRGAQAARVSARGRRVRGPVGEGASCRMPLTWASMSWWRSSGARGHWVGSRAQDTGRWHVGADCGGLSVMLDQLRALATYPDDKRWLSRPPWSWLTVLERETLRWH